MRLLPVIDIMHGVVVRGVAGNRGAYQPLQSLWTTSTDPYEVAVRLRETFGFQRFYIADLDGILQRTPHTQLYRQLAEAGFELLVDAGIREAAEAEPLLAQGVTSVIAGLETLSGPHALSALLDRCDSDRVVFSLDLQAGIPLIPPSADWPDRRPQGIAKSALALGVRSLIVLDLADVGTGTGGSTAELCRTLRQDVPDVALIAGGGVRGLDDVSRWEQVGISELLVASALHDGRISPADLPA